MKQKGKPKQASAHRSSIAKQRRAIETVSPGGEVVLYQAADGKVSIHVRLERETVWLTQAQMAELFGRERSVITKHIQNVFTERELLRKSNVQNLHIASSDKPVAFYSLDVVISVGYRVKSKQGTRFRIWATQTLRDHILRGYTLNQQRLHGRGAACIAGRAAGPPRILQPYGRGQRPPMSIPTSRDSSRRAGVSRYMACPPT
jgi:hypothetical protein